MWWSVIKDWLWSLFHTEAPVKPTPPGVGPPGTIHTESNDINDVLNPDGTVKT